MACESKIEGPIEYIHCDNARDFLDCLQIRNPIWLPDKAQKSTWVFRGQQKSQWSLMPSALRPTTTWFDKFKDDNRATVLQILEAAEVDWKPDEYRPDNDILSELVLQVLAERCAVEEFIEFADRVGHPIPEDKRLGLDEPTAEHVVRDMLKWYRQKPQPYHFVPGTIEFALAQHHGIPTRLLDWTIMPFVAAFFASESAVKSNDNIDYDIAVWAFNRSYGDAVEFEIITQRRAKISYLHAQGGISLCDRMANYYFVQHGNWRPFEEAIAESSISSDRVILRKITLPAACVHELMRLLAVENLTRAHLMPTYDNVMETLRMQRVLAKKL